MYLRHVKQFLRAADPSFDERRYGFSGLNELVRACQKDGLFRLERGRQGVLRVFGGASLQGGPVPLAGELEPAVHEAEPPADVPAEVPTEDLGAGTAALADSSLSGQAGTKRRRRRHSTAVAGDTSPRKPARRPRPRKAPEAV